MAAIISTTASIVGLVDAPAKIKQYLFDPIKAQFSYLFRYSNFIEVLREKDGRINPKIESLKERIGVAESNLEKIYHEFKEWLREADELKENIHRILIDAPRVQNGTCLQGTCPDLKSRHSSSREAERLAAKIDELLTKYTEFGGRPISYPGPREGNETIPSRSDTIDFDSREKAEEEIMSCLRDHSIRMVGVWGMGGVGKTTMAEKIGKRAFQEKLFDKTLMAPVSQQVDLPAIQQRLADGLGLHLTKEEAEPIRAKKLYDSLMMKEKVLIILDDVWKWLKLEEIGIPSQPQIKILLTTRDRGVCQSMSIEEATRILELKVLGYDEAISLFRENAGRIVDQPNFHHLAVKLAEKCKGLPLALVILGRSLRGENDKSIWEESLRQMQKAAPANIPGYLQDVFQPLERSYFMLESDKARYLFLLCCLFPEDSEIETENLVRYTVGIGIFSAIESSIGAIRNEVNYIIKKLINRCLLMDAGENSWPTYVKMHDVIRDMALAIASSGKHVFKVSHDKGLREWPRGSYTSMSLTLGEAMSFPESIDCPELKALLLTFDFTGTGKPLPINSFNGMKDLTLLSICGFDSPFPSTSSLTKLQVLHLDECHLEDISLIGQLTDLQILSFRESYIYNRVLPDEIGGLKKLKLLDMTNCAELENIESGVFSALTQLEELRLMGCPIRWECRGRGDEGRNASLAQVFSLKNLSFLEIWIKYPEAISQEMDHSQNLTCYSVVIGEQKGRFSTEGTFSMEGSYTDLKRMSVNVDERIDSPIAISRLLRGAGQLKLNGNGCKGIIELLGREGFRNTESLEINELDNLETIYDGPPTVELFAILEYLTLRYLSGRLYLWKYPGQKVSMSNLKRIYIEMCVKLEWLLPLPLGEGLCQLESIVVWRCPIIEEVFKDERGSKSGITIIKFPNLKEMMLDELPMLGALCNAVDVVMELPSIKRLAITKVSANFRILDNQLDRMLLNFSGLEDLNIESCHSLSILFSPAVFRGLINLEQLHVKDCEMLENIVGIKEGESITKLFSEVLSFPKFRWLKLSKLPKIRYFCPFRNALEFPLLQSVDIDDCPMMETLGVDEHWWGGSSSSIPIIARLFLTNRLLVLS